ncbi:MAG TPA: serine/threonine-protein kinase [Kofleriaceae bacterium]|nr:serine/threonine-protein kinase [Kofleriaceae bacterium]
MSVGVSGKYRLDRRLGGGGMAEVFLGSTMGAEGFSRKVAIKRVLPGYSDNPGFAQMFVAEAQISSQLVHPNIVSVLDFDRDAEARLFLVMELVEGRDLDTLLATGNLPVPVVIFVIGEVLRGLGFAHDLPATTGDTTGMRGIIHRDVSPHNVLLSWEGAVKVSDFGIAKARAASEATASVFIKGKPAYMSPEQANGQRLDGRSDLFAVGVMLWEMLVGQRLFVAEDTRATLAAVLFGQIPRPRAVRPDIPKDVERVAMKLLERDLPVRYTTAEDALADLMNCADAPRGGREALTAVLAERFPHDAPVRQSIARARSLGIHPTPVPGSLHAPSPQPTATAPGFAPAGPAASRPGLGTLRAAPTGTLELPRRRGLAVALAVVAAALVGVIAFFAVTAARTPAPPAPTNTPANGGTPTVSDDAHVGDMLHAAPGSTSPGAAISVDASVPASTGSAPHAAVSAQAPSQPPAQAPQPPAQVAAQPPTPALPQPPLDAAASHATSASSLPPRTVEKRQGTLSVLGMPVLTVTVDGKHYGDTPISIKLKIGKHRVELTNVENNINEVLPNVIINENQTTPIERIHK